MKIGRRNIGIFLARSFSVQNWKAMTMFKKVHTEPLKSIYQELFSAGKYPRLIKFKSPTGLHEVKLYSPNDFSTFNLIFCRQDYFTTNNFKTVVDIGSNIGISAVFWLTRNYQSKVYCYEPSSANYKRLKFNLQSFKSRFFLNNCAVSNYNDFAYLNLEKNGVYTSLNKKDKKHDYIGKEKCEVVDINKCLEKILKENSIIDILKIDNEGEEINTISSIDTSFWKFIKCVNVDGDNVRKYVPSDFKSDKIGSAQRFYKT
tara:strand:- start:2253 stop:3029 length:777 start_codon:yes stop_codon:yes gene_type:complete